MKLLKTFLLVLITSVMVLAKMGFAAPSDSDLNFLSAMNALEDTPVTSGHGDYSSIKHLHQPIDDHLIGIDLEEEEKEDSNEKKRSADLLSCSVSFEPISDYVPHSIGTTSKFKGISEMQSLRLHLVFEKFQI